MIKTGTKKLVSIAVAFLMALSLTSVGLWLNLSFAHADATEISVSAEETLSGTARLNVSKVVDGGEEEENDPLEIYVDFNRVYKGPFAEAIDLDTTRLKNGTNRVIKAVYKTKSGTFTATKTVAVSNDGGDDVTDPVQVITPQMMAGFEWLNSSTVTVSADGKYATITNCNIADPATLTVDFGTKESLNAIEIGAKFYESNEAGTVRRVRFRISSATLTDDTSLSEANFDWAITDYNGDTNEFGGIDLRTVAGGDGNRANIYGNANIDVMIMSDSGATVKAEYVTVASYSSVPLAVMATAPRIDVTEKAIDKFTQSEDVTFTVNANGNPLAKVTGPYNAEGAAIVGDAAITAEGYVLTEGTGENETVTVKLDYLKTLSVGKKYFRVENDRAYAVFSIDISDTTPVPVTSIEVTNGVTSALAGDTFDFDVRIDPSDATAPAVVWSVSDPSLATIDAETGAVKFMKAGKVTVTVSVTGKTVTGAQDEAKTASFEVSVSENPIMPVIKTPAYNSIVKNGLLVQVEKQVNDDTDTLEKMIVYVGDIKVYEDVFVPAFSIDTTKFANGLTSIRVEFDTAKTTENAFAETQVHIVNDAYKICYPSIEEIATVPTDNQNSVAQIVRDIDGNVLGVQLSQVGGAYAGFRAWMTPVQGVDFTHPENIVMSFSVRSFEGVNENSKIYTQLVIQNPNGIGRDIGLNGLLDIKAAGSYTITLKEMFDREVAAERLPDYDLVSSLTSANFYYVILIENEATAVVDQFAVNFAFDDTAIDYTGVVTTPKIISVIGDAEKDYDVYTGTSNITFEIDSDGLDITITGNNISADAYGFSGNTLTIYRSYLNAIGKGDYDFEISSGIGDPVIVTVHVVDTTPAAPEVVGESTASFNKGTPADVTFRLDLKGTYLTSVTGSDITTSDYVIDEDGNFTIRKEFLMNCASGERTFTLTTDGGFVKVKVNVTAVAGKQDKVSGCGSAIGFDYYSAILALAVFIGASAAIFFRKKQKNI